MLYIKLFIEREKNTGQSAPECPFNAHPESLDRLEKLFFHFTCFSGVRLYC